MTTFVSMLRGVNVGGRRRLKMSGLAETFTSLGFENVRTYVQSGNVVFSTNLADESSLAKRVEKELKSRLGLDVVVIIRTSNELAGIVGRNPFAGKEQSKLHVTFLYTKPARVPIEKMEGVRGEDEEFAVSGREVFLFLPNGYGRTKLSNNFFEKALNVPATTRNWNTVTTLLEMAK
jgi:uncharacterized protein (DUF1697 family)